MEATNNLQNEGADSMTYREEAIRADQMEAGEVYRINGEYLEITEIKPLWYDKNKNTLVITAVDYEGNEGDFQLYVSATVYFEGYGA